MVRYFKNIYSKLSKSTAGVKQFLEFVNQVKPTEAFDYNSLPAAPNYASLDVWAAHPNIDSKVSLVPKDLEFNIKEKKVDVFFVHPTTYFGKHNWNAAIDSPGAIEFLNEMVVPGEASMFNPYADVYIPKYRQATFYSFWEAGRNAKKALQVAYEDIVNAFKYYLEHHNHGRPFIIASHSQGTILAMRLVEEYIDPFPLHKKLVCAYLIGFRFPQDKFNSHLKNLKPSIGANDIHSIISWDTFEEGGNAFLFLDRAEYWYHQNDEWKWHKRAKKTPHCVNPVSWNIDIGSIDASRHKGGVYVELENNRVDLKKLWSDETLGLNAIG
ncbi:MAG: DUF3089 domain-containing protein, partial [Bacteroidota bacterium]